MGTDNTGTSETVVRVEEFKLNLNNQVWEELSGLVSPIDGYKYNAANDEIKILHEIKKGFFMRCTRNPIGIK